MIIQDSIQFWVSLANGEMQLFFLPFLETDK